MRLSKFFKREPQERNHPASTAKSSANALVAHKIFVPLLTIWGAILFGGALLVLPGSAILRISTLTGLGAMGGFAQFVFAAIAAVLGGLTIFFFASGFRNRTLKHEPQDAVASALVSRRSQTINPTVDLGSESLDAPIEQIPFAGEEEGEFEELPESLFDTADDTQGAEALETERQPTLGELAERNYELDEPEEPKSTSNSDETPGFTRRHFKAALIESCEGATCEAAPTEELLRKKPVRDEASKPRELDLSEFAEMPGRDAVWVEEPAEQEEETSAATALEKLRQRPPAELSMVEMVERFAGALHERQKAERERRPGAPQRDSALAEALKALSMFNEYGFDPSALANPDPEIASAELSRTERDLRDALSKLQNLRGAA